MRFSLTLITCCGADECESSTTLTSFVSKENDSKNPIVGLVREKKLVAGGKSGRQPEQWRPSLCTISEEDVIKAERVQLYVKKPSNNGKKNSIMSSPNFTHFGYKNEFMLRDSWDKVSPVPTAFLF